MSEKNENQEIAEVQYVDKEKVNMYLKINQKYFPEDKLMFLKEKLCLLGEEQFKVVSFVEMKDPTTILLVSIFVGYLGIDRFMLQETGMGVLKLLTAGCCGILTVIDWFTIQNRVKNMNFNNLINNVILKR